MGDSKARHSPRQVPSAAKSAPVSPGLYIVATPIGNLRDITLRALDVLAGADEILAEDTRVASKLLNAHGIKATLSPYHDHNGAERRAGLLDKLQGGAAIALISDAGTPLISDPGWKLVREALERDIKIIPIPGASALLAGLVTSGLPSDRFLFAGFFPQKASARSAICKELKNVRTTLVFYESGPRLAAALAAMRDGLGDKREACVARELTKMFEETRRGSLAELAGHYAAQGPPKGEIVILIGPPGERTLSESDIDAALNDALSEMPTKQAANAVADALGLPKRDVYQRALELKRNG